MKLIIITIDGYSSCGKSTLAKQLANQLNYTFIDSGAMYRAITFYFLRNNIDLKNHSAIKKALHDIHIEFSEDENKKTETILNGENVEALIREMIVSEKVSEVAAIKEVREFAIDLQQKAGEKKGIVMDGRDIGTTVFPDAELKIFMTADIAVRTERRFKELYQQNKNITIEEVIDNIETRDYIDTNRKISPLRKADEAIILDNTNLSEEQQLKLALKWAKQKIKT